MLLLGALFLGCAFVLVYRLYTFQWIEHAKYAEAADDAHKRIVDVAPLRGSIYDTNGNPLAVTVQLDALTVIGRNVKQADEVAQSLAPLLEMHPNDILSKIDPTRGDPVTIKDRLPSAVADAIGIEIERRGLQGLALEPRPVRQYPEGSIAPQVLGFIGKDREGLAGLEWLFDEELTGEPGQIETEIDITRQELILGRRIVKPVRDGTDYVLTIDRYVQRTIERDLADAVKANKASGGLILVMEPATGAILGMATYPTFTIADPMTIAPGEEMFHKAAIVTNQYEPGSVMKLITMAAAIEKGVVTPTTIINDNGILSFPTGAGRPPMTIKNWDLRANGPITVTETLIRSSNIATAQVAQKLGKEELYKALGLFGFGERTGIELPGEVPGTVRTPADPAWSVVDLATNSFGQGIAVTPLQMLNAIASISNDGVLMRPTIIRELNRSDGPTIVAPRPIRRVMSVETARTMREMMVAVDEQPGLLAHRIPGIRVAAKTGTADFPTNLGYTSGKTFASMAVLLPADKPRLAILIRLDAPEAIYGGAVAAPVLKRVGSELAAYYRIPANTDGN